MPIIQLTKAAIALLKKNPELAEELGRIGRTALRQPSKVTKKTTPPKTRRKKVGQGKGGGRKKQFTGKEKARVRMYIDPTTGKKYSSYAKGLKDVEDGVAVHKNKWQKTVTDPVTGEKKTVRRTARKKDTRSEEEKEAALKKSQAQIERDREALHKRLEITPSRAKEGSEKYNKDMQKVVRILDNETPSMKNLRAAGETPRGGITGITKSLAGPKVGSPYTIGGKYHRPPTTHAQPIQYGQDIQTGMLPQEGRHLEEKAIKALNLPKQEEIKRLKQLELFYGRRIQKSLRHPETGEKLPEQLASERQVRGDVPVSSIIGGRDEAGRPLSRHLIEMSSKERGLAMADIRDRVPGLTKEERQRIVQNLWFEGESKLPKGFVDKKTGDDVIQWRMRPEWESRSPIATPGINEPKWNPNTQQYENLTSQTRYVPVRPAYPAGSVAEDMGLRGSPSQIINPSLTEGAAVTRTQALEHLPEVAHTPSHLKSPVTKFPAQRGSIDLPMARRAEQTEALSQPLDVTQQRILENLQRSRRAAKLAGRGEEEVIRQAGMQARAASVRKDPTLRTFDPDLKAPVPKVTAQQKAVEKAREKINREVIAIRAKKREFDRLVANGIETPESLLKRKDHKAWSKKRKTLKKTINKKYPEWQEYIPDESGVPVWQGKYVDSFKKGNIIARKSGGQLKKPRGWGAARYKI